MHKLNVLVAGSTGYIGVQLIKLLVKHSDIKIKYLCGNLSVGKNISWISLFLGSLPRKSPIFPQPTFLDLHRQVGTVMTIWALRIA